MTKRKKLSPKKIERWEGITETDTWGLVVISAAKLRALVVLMYAQTSGGSKSQDLFGLSHILEEIADDLDKVSAVIDGVPVRKKDDPEE